MKVLTHDAVINHNWHQISILTADLIEKEGYTYIDNYAFEDCGNLISIELPNTIVYIGRGAFLNCYNLLSIIIPNSVISIEESAFDSCISLRLVNIPNSIETINTGTFSYCKELTSIVIPNSVTSIRDWAFEGCSDLTSIYISNNVKKIGFSVFDNCGIKLPKCYDNQGRLIAYKGFDYRMCCRGFQYKEGETYITEKAKLCKYGFHACINPLDIFNYYYGAINKDVFIHEVYLENITDEIRMDSKVVGTKITIGRRLFIEDINKIIAMS